MTDVPTLRVARPTDDLDAVLRFYRDGLGLPSSIALRITTASTA